MFTGTFGPSWTSLGCRFGAQGRTRTGTVYTTRPSNVRVYQFRHLGKSVDLKELFLYGSGDWSASSGHDRGGRTSLKDGQGHRGQNEQSEKDGRELMQERRRSARTEGRLGAATAEGSSQ